MHENRGKKRTEIVDELPADKRACSSMEFRASSSGSSSVPETSTRDMDTLTPENLSDREIDKDLEHDSDSDDDDDDSMRSRLREYQLRRSSRNGEKLESIMLGLTEESDPSKLLAALTALCDLVNYSSEGSFNSQVLDMLSRLLVKLSDHESNPEFMLLATRAMTYMCDACPRSSSFLVRHDAVSVLCRKLVAIEYMDVAEQCLNALEKISENQPLACLEAGAVMAVLRYIDFFSISVQRVAVSTVVNICKNFPSKYPHSFMEAVPKLCNLLRYEDQKLVENVAICIIKITKRVSRSSELFNELCQHDLIQQVMHLINLKSRAPLSEATYNNFIRLLRSLCSGSILAFRTLYELGISRILKNLISSHDITHGTFFTRVIDRQHSQAHEVLKLLHELLPTSTRNQDVQQLSDKELFLISRPDLLQKLAENMVPLFFQVVNSGASIYVCYGCLSVIDKIVYLSKSDMLVELLKNANIASFLAGVVSQKDPHVRILALQIVNVILKRHCDTFLNAFAKEGVIFAIDALSTSENHTEVMLPPVGSVQVPDGSSQKTFRKGLERCLCYAFTGLAPSPSEPITCKLEKDSIVQLAKRMRIHYTLESCGPEIGVTNVLQKLKILASTLNDTTSEQEFQHILIEIMETVSGREHVSTFEFVESGILKSLLNYLFNGLNGRGNKESRGFHTHIKVVERRFEIFARLFLFSSAEPAEASRLSVLTRRLHSALSVLENFPVVLNHATKRRISYAMVPKECAMAHPCLKVQFVREKGETSLSDFSKDCVTVDPFCPLDAIEGFLWPKVNKSLTKPVKSTDNQHEPGIIPEMQEYDTKLAQLAYNLEMTLRQANPAALSSSDKYLDVSVQNNVQVLSEVDQNLSTQNSETCSPNDTVPKLLLCLEGHTLDHQLTLYQAIIQQQMKAEQDIRLSPELWNQVHTITYKRAVRSMQDNLQETITIEQEVPHTSFMSSVYDPLVSDLEDSNPSNNILHLLKSLEEMSRFMFHLMSRERIRAFAEGRINNLDDVNIMIPTVPQKEFLSSKLTDKLEQQMRDHLALSVGAMPLWWSQLMTRCPFLFSFDTKCKYFRLEAFGIMQFQPQLSSRSSSGGLIHRQARTNSSPHRKYLVSRDQILECATQIMDLHAHNKVPIEVEYNGEVGTGLGPTLEFYTLVSHEFQKSGLGMWREHHISFEKDLQGKCSRMVVAPFGLFPRPWPSNLDETDDIKFTEVINKFFLLGKVVAKALQERRMLDLPFSKFFFKLILGQELTVYDIPSFDPEFGRTLLEFQALVERKKVIKSYFGEKLLFEYDQCYRDAKIDDLCLDFTLPGYPDYVFTTDPDHTMVNMSNLDSYITHIVDATIHKGISRQVEAFRCGFNEVFSIKSLEIFTEEELEQLLCGEHELWSFHELIEHIKFDHGYTARSPPIINLLELIQEFDREQRRAFLWFVTGAPQLPPGGLVSLSPELTIVRKHSDNPADTDLPSVMTCAHYLKLPPYTSKEVMKEKLLYAISEGQGSFHLS